MTVMIGTGALAGAGNCLDFEPAYRQYAEIPLTLPESGTIELWYKAESLYNYNTIFDNSTHENDWELWIYESGELRFRIEDGDLRVDLNEIGNATGWNHIAVTWQRHDSTNVDYDLWVNGVQRSSLTDTTWVDPGDTFYLGGGHLNNTTGDGMIDDVRIWSDVRTGAEIADNMNVELNGNEADLLAYYRMNQIGGTNLPDAASGGYPCTLVNMSDDCWVASSAPIRYATHDGDSPVHYVSPDGGNVWPFTNWADAAVNIQDAVDAAQSNDTVRVADGTYDTGGAITPGYDLFNRICITNAITVESVNGPDSTFIVGAGGMNGPTAVRGVYMEAGELSGFTVMDGHTLLNNGDMVFDKAGGGIFCTDATPVITNCTISGSSA